MARRKVMFDFNPLKGVRLKSETAKKQARQAVKEYVLEEVLSQVGEGRSPVTGRKWAKLTKQYAEREKFGSRLANLELTGRMLDSVRVLEKGNQLRLTVTQSQQKKADGHNNFSGLSSLPERRFVPDGKANQTFNKKIQKGIQTVLARFKDPE